jgi:hypothetical protein
MEHRWGRRAPVDVAVTLRLASGALETARIVNLSLSGALLRTQARLPAYSRVTVKLDVCDYIRGAPQLVLAHVVREAPGGVGIEWSEFSPPAICALLVEAADARQSSPDVKPAQVGDVEPPLLSRRHVAARVWPGPMGSRV